MFSRPVCHELALLSTMNIYESIELTPEEIEAALLEGRKKKYFHVKHREYWETQDKTKPSLQGKERKEYTLPST